MSSATRCGGGSWSCSPTGELTSGAVTAAVRDEFGISQPAVSQHLRVLREHGFATVRPDGTRRLYAVRPEPLQEVDAWLDASAGSGLRRSTRWPPSWRAGPHATRSRS